MTEQEDHSLLRSSGKVESSKPLYDGVASPVSKPHTAHMPLPSSIPDNLSFPSHYLEFELVQLLIVTHILAVSQVIVTLALDEVVLVLRGFCTCGASSCPLLSA